MKNVVLTGGGTGGHLFAALTFAEYIKKKGFKPIIIGSQYGIEREILKRYPFEYYLLSSKGIAGKNIKEKLKGVVFTSKAFISSYKLIKIIEPIFCIGFGGYVSLPVMLSAVMLRKKTAILEQNSIPGKTNKILNRLVDITFVNFPITAQYLKNAITVGNPTRIKFKGTKRETKDKITIGVIGGSRGARSINNAMIELSKYELNIDVVHQTGKDDFKRVKEAYKESKKSWQVFEFIDDMESFYSSIDFIICRAGASTLSEIACAGLGSLLIPYPYAIYNHQYYNAKYFKDNDAAEIILDKDLSGKKIYSFISFLTAEKIEQMSENAKKLCEKDSCEKMLKILESGL
ncbi:undecaprenyldiphospho-muramoylpentapeptide beta-N-acetylglucosaminyltransferase [Hippea alviniae]|uniref:undecaprenyldiphospho-muramoylpentapeptide beta-N-acetylglucosaminyltransferase n=1 Tax=Hippea alviniae TaxID=1279027 RepID=UPI0003B42532|nr:undecaprenyldiphospho-muramoylpentapeptide beta-N-acetylglucosaminyltransferase [Hippea alviniae]